MWIDCVPTQQGMSAFGKKPEGGGGDTVLCDVLISVGTEKLKKVKSCASRLYSGVLSWFWSEMFCF